MDNLGVSNTCFLAFSSRPRRDSARVLDWVRWGQTDNARLEMPEHGAVHRSPNFSCSVIDQPRGDVFCLHILSLDSAATALLGVR